MQLGSTYLIVKDMKTSLDYYEQLLEVKASSRNIKRWAEFHVGHNCIALFNPQFDIDMIKKGDDLDICYNKEYLQFKENTLLKYGNNVVLNFGVPDLRAEYERIKALNISPISEIMYINIVVPYYCFMLEDPDGNLIEITGKYK